MNDWMCPRLTWDDAYQPDRGKVLTPEELEGLKTRFSRYLDVDGDGIAARTLPGVHAKGAYFARGSGHDKHAAYTEDAAEYQEVVDRLTRKLTGAAAVVPGPEVRWATDVVRGARSEVRGTPSGGSPRTTDHAPRPADIGIISLGGCDAAVLEAVDTLKANDISADYMRIRAFPFGRAVRQFIESHERSFVVEQNRDGQLRSLLAIETGVARDRMTSVLDYGGLPLTAERVVTDVTRELEGVPA
jgi:2-oxoglutarate ferredoxin oxidoreductase subunit alpha